ncbi:MAG: DUF4276 family protein [Polyangiaceae bacterium]|nr:DUF4276 family protein [Polyangiaceae bacterium]
MIYLRAGVYAEGASDYRFLCPLLDRHIDSLAASLFPGSYEVADTVGIDAPTKRKASRADRIAAAIVEYSDTCEMFVIHSDGAGDPDGARATCIDPGVTAACATLPDVVAVACVPVREIEAWLLTDPDAFKTLLGSSFIPELPAEPEKDIDPKATLRKILKDGGARPGPESIHALFGERVRFEALRSLPAFQAFEVEMVEAIKRVAGLQGHRL